MISIDYYPKNAVSRAKTSAQHPKCDTVHAQQHSTRRTKYAERDPKPDLKHANSAAATTPRHPVKISVEDADQEAANEKSMGCQIDLPSASPKTLKKSDKRTTAFAPLLDPDARVRHFPYLHINTVMMS
jgi:hypothetical protein